MQENRSFGSEGGGAETTRPSLPPSFFAFDHSLSRRVGHAFSSNDKCRQCMGAKDVCECWSSLADDHSQFASSLPQKGCFL